MFVLVIHSTELYVRFHSGCIFAHELLYHDNHMIVQMMSITVEIVLLVPEFWIHMHSFEICAYIMQIVEVFILNHIQHHCLCFSKLSNANQTKATLILINLLFGSIYCD